VTEKDYPGGRIPSDRAVVRSLNGGGDVPGRLSTFDAYAAIDDRPADLVTGLVSLAFMKAATRRRARFWWATALIGLVIGGAYYASSPPVYKATTSLLLTPGPYENVNTAASNDEAMAASRSVAQLAIRRLGLTESPASLLATYTATAITERVLAITVSAPTSAAAVDRAGAVAAAFLQFRATEMQSEQKLVLDSLNQQIEQAQQRLNSLNAQITDLSGQSQPDTQRLKSLRNERTQETAALYSLQQSALGNQSVTQPATAAAVNGSVVLDGAIPLAHSRFKPLVVDGGIGLIFGMFLGLAIVVIQALVSDKLRTRDDIAQALRGPVKLSVGPVRYRRWLPGRRGRSQMDHPEVLRIARHLSELVPAHATASASLAVVPVDDVRVPALALVSLATSRAGQGERVVVADLCRGAPAAKLLGAGAPGVGPVSGQDGDLVVAVPKGDEVVPGGPLQAGRDEAGKSAFAEEVAAACQPGSLLLTLVTLEPSLGSEHLATWAADAVVMVTAGGSSWTKIRGVSELIRLSGTRRISAVLVGADKTDESLGLARTPEAV
jgi:capsular polysaccharide biosynthesis protein